MYRGEADWSAIARAVQLVRGSGTLLFGNGDVQNLSELVRRVRETGVDGVLVGRAALGAPWFFEARKKLGTMSRRIEPWEADPRTPALTARFECFSNTHAVFEAQWGPQQFRRMRKHLGWYCKGFPHAAALRASMFHVSSVAESKRCLRTIEAAGSSTAARLMIRPSPIARPRSPGIAMRRSAGVNVAASS